MDEFQTETGETFPDADAARVLSQAIDEDTMSQRILRALILRIHAKDLLTSR